MMNIFWKCIYTINRKLICYIYPPIIVANTFRSTFGDEYVTVTGNGWVTVKSKTDKEYTDMLPITMVSDKCIEDLVRASFFNAEKILKDMK